MGIADSVVSAGAGACCDDGSSAKASTATANANRIADAMRIFLTFVIG